MKKLAIIYPNLKLGGVQKKISQISNRIKETNQAEITIILRELETSDIFFNDLKSSNIKIKVCPFKKIKNKFLKNTIYFFYITIILATLNPTHILTFLFNFNLLVVGYKCLYFWRKPKIILSQDNVVSLINKKPYINTQIPNFLVKFSLFLPNKIIALSEHIKKDLPINSHKVSVIPNWVIPPKIKNITKDIDIIYVGRFHPRKQLHKIIFITYILKRKHPNIQTYLVGDGITKNKLLKQINKLNLENNVKLIPPTKKVSTYLSRAKLTFLTSKFEGHPLAILEAMSLGVIPIILDYPGAKKSFQKKPYLFITNSTTNMYKISNKLIKNNKIRNYLRNKVQNKVQKENNMKLLDKHISLILF